jgi:lipoprotein-releasing system permease protein
MPAVKSAPPFGLFERMLAGRYLRAKRAHGGVAMISIISLVGIMLAVAVLIITMSVMNGFRETLLSRILGVNGHVFVDTQGKTGEEIETMLERARATPGVLSAMPVIEGQALAVQSGRVAGAVVRGLYQADVAKHFAEIDALSDDGISALLPGGSLVGFDSEDDPSILIGRRLALQLGAVEAGFVTLLSPQGAATPFGVAPRRKTFTVGGLFEVGMAEYDQLLIYMPMAQAQLFFDRAPGGADRLELKVKDPDDTLRVMQALRLNLGDEVYIFDWKAQRESLVGALVVERNVMRLILMMIVAIAAMNIISGLVMLVTNKRGDIAIMRTIGATKGSILRIFFMTGAAIGLVGTGLGLLIGTAICIWIGPIQNFLSTVIGWDIFPGDVYSLESLPAKLDWGEVMLVTTWSLLMSFLATLPQAWRASRMDPVEALRYE